MRIKATALLVLTAALCAGIFASLALAEGGSGGIQFSSIKGDSFPQRQYVLTLPQQQELTSKAVHIRENGVGVQDLKVTPIGQAKTQSYGVVLAIDASGSMKDKIGDAMAAARRFASERQPNQALGVIFFNGKVSVALPPTTDAKRIEQILAKPPVLGAGTHIYDATAAAIEQLNAANIKVGNVVVVSDGDDAGGSTSAAKLSSDAKNQGVRIFTVGINSQSFDGATLKGLAQVGGGSFFSGASGDLSKIFSGISKTLARQYEVSYKSPMQAGSEVVVSAKVDGYPGIQWSYAAIGGANAPGQFWSSPVSMILMVLLLVLLLGTVVFMFSRSLRVSVQSRVRQFVKPSDPIGFSPESDAGLTAISDNVHRSLKKHKWWENLEEELDIARIPISAMRLASGTIGVTLMMFCLCAFVFNRTILAILCLGIPIVVLLWIRIQLNKQRNAFGEQLADNLNVIASAMRAGHSFIGALSEASEDAPEPSKREFKRVVREEELGIAIEESLAQVGRRMRSQDVEYVGLVATLQRDTGGNTAEVIDRVTETVRERAMIRRLIKTLTAQGRLGGIIVSLLPVGLIALISISNPHFLDPLINEPGGRVLLGIGFVMMVCGWFLIRKIINIKV